MSKGDDERMEYVFRRWGGVLSRLSEMEACELAERKRCIAELAVAQWLYHRRPSYEFRKGKRAGLKRGLEIGRLIASELSDEFIDEDPLPEGWEVEIGTNFFDLYRYGHNGYSRKLMAMINRREVPPGRSLYKAAVRLAWSIEQGL